MRPRARHSDRVINRPTRVVTRNVRVPALEPLAAAFEDLVIEETVEISPVVAECIEMGEPIQHVIVRECPLVARRRAVMAKCCQHLKEQAEAVKRRETNDEPIASGSGTPSKTTGAIPKVTREHIVGESIDESVYTPAPDYRAPFPDHRERIYEHGFYVPGQEILSSGRYYWCDPYSVIGVRQSYGTLNERPVKTTQVEVPTETVKVAEKVKSVAELEQERVLAEVDVSVRTKDTYDYDVDEKFYHDCKHVARELRKKADTLESTANIDLDIATPSESEDAEIVGRFEVTDSEIDRAMMVCPICDTVAENESDKKTHWETYHRYNGDE